MKLFLRLLFFVLLIATKSSHATDVWSVGFNGAGPLKIGMRINDVNQLLHEIIAPPSVPGADPSGRCFQTDITSQKGMYLMFYDGVLVRIDLAEPGMNTISGIGVGDKESAVLHAYGARIKREPHAYVEGSYLRMFSADGKRGLTFEITDGKVSLYYVGTADSVQLIEGCS
ncbi:MAG TPA: hypothetical protein VIF82_01470 [Burkholderiaceae bacterium]|jgi:hypothetical protein